MRSDTPPPPRRGAFPFCLQNLSCNDITTTPAEYAQLLAFRTALREFLHWSASQARAAGVTPAQHQLLLAVKGHGDEPLPSMGELARLLLVRPHSAVELVDRAVAAGLVERVTDRRDSRVVRVRATPAGERVLQTLSDLHIGEIRRLAPLVDAIAAPGGADS